MTIEEISDIREELNEIIKRAQNALRLLDAGPGNVDRYAVICEVAAMAKIAIHVEVETQANELADD